MRSRTSCGQVFCQEAGAGGEGKAWGRWQREEGPLLASPEIGLEGEHSSHRPRTGALWLATRRAAGLYTGGLRIGPTGGI